MNILELDDLSLYLRIRKGIKFYYFGQGCLADYYLNSIAYLDLIDTAIILHIDGTLSINELIKKIIEREDSVCSELVLKQRIQQLIQKNIIIARKKASYKKTIINGKWGKFYPKKITIELANVCNFNCSFCYKDAKKRGSFISNEVIKEVDCIIKNNVKEIQLTGGEPTLHPHFLEYIELFSNYAGVSMITNGSELYKYDDERLNRLAHVQFSLYGYDEKSYEEATGIKDALLRLSKSIAIVKKRGVSFAIAVTLCNKTIDYIENYIKIAIGFGAKTIRIGYVEPFGRELELYVDDKQYQKKVEELPNKLLRYKLKYKNKINVSVNNFEREKVDNDIRLNHEIYTGCLQCGRGIEDLVISQEGQIRACAYLPEDVFNMGGIEYLKEFINGKMKKEELYKSIKCYCNYMSNTKAEPCIAIRQYYEKYIL